MSAPTSSTGDRTRDLTQPPLGSATTVSVAESSATPAKIRQLLWYRWVVFTMIGLSGMLMYFHFAWGATLSSYHTAVWSLDASQLALLSALGFILFALMQIPGGYLTDMLGARKMLTAAVMLLALGTAVFAAAPDFGVALAGRTLIGLGTGIIISPALKMLACWFRAREYATIQGAFILLGTFGALMATLPLAVASERWDWRGPMWFVAGMTALAAVAIWLTVRNDPTDLGLPSISTVDPEAKRVQATPPTERPSFRAGFYVWRSIPTLWMIAVILFATTGTLWSFQALWAGPLMRHVRSLSVTETGSALMMFTLGKGLGPVLFGFISDRLVQARKPVVVFAVVGQTVLWVLIIFSFARLPLPLLYLAFVALSALSGGVLVSQVMIKELSPPHLFGTIYGIINGSGFYGVAVIQLITGSVLKASGPVSVAGEPIYSAQAYTLALSPIIVFMLIATLFSFKLDETLGSQRSAALKLEQM